MTVADNPDPDGKGVAGPTGENAAVRKPVIRLNMLGFSCGLCGRLVPGGGASGPRRSTVFGANAVIALR